MSQKYNQSATIGTRKELTINGVIYKANMHRVCYHVHHSIQKTTRSASCELIDRGVNVGVAGKDVHIICSIPGRLVSVRRID